MRGRGARRRDATEGDASVRGASPLSVPDEAGAATMSASRAAIFLRYAMIGILFLCLGVAAFAVMRQVELDRFREASGMAAVAAVPDDRRRAAAALAGCGGAQPAEIMLACATGYAALAAKAGEPRARAQALATGRASVQILLRDAPRRADLWVLAAYFAALSDRRREAVSDLCQSYRHAPFLRAQAEWRLWFGAHAWPTLSRSCRAALVDEALWYQELGYERRMATQAALAGTPPFILVALRAPGRGGAGLAVRDDASTGRSPARP